MRNLNRLQHPINSSPLTLCRCVPLKLCKMLTSVDLWTSRDDIFFSCGCIVSDWIRKACCSASYILQFKDTVSSPWCTINAECFCFCRTSHTHHVTNSPHTKRTQTRKLQNYISKRAVRSDSGCYYFSHQNINFSRRKTRKTATNFP